MATKWVLDPTHSEVNFRAKHLVISTVSGKFRKFNGTVETPNNNSFDSAKVDFTIDVASIDTNQEPRDEHLRSADFFDAANHPTITFKSTSFKAKNNESDEFVLTGDLTIRGITKSIDVDVEFGGTTTDAYGNFKAGFDVSGKVNRKEFGLSWNAVTEAGSVVVGDMIRFQISVQFIRQ